MKPYLWGILSGIVLLIVAVTLYLGRLSGKQDRRRMRAYAEWDVYRGG